MHEKVVKPNIFTVKVYFYLINDNNTACGSVYYYIPILAILWCVSKDYKML